MRTTANIGSGYLQTYLKKEVLENLEPNLYFAQYGMKNTMGDGYFTMSWPRVAKLTRTIAQATLTEGVVPTDTDITFSTISATPVQYGIYAKIPDLLIKTSPTNIIANAGSVIGANMARIMDKVIQAELLNGTNIILPAGRANRAAITGSDIITGTMISNTTTKLRSLNANPISQGCFYAICHSFVAGDIRNTSSGLWIEANKYTTNETILNGEVGKLSGIRFMETSNIDSITSTTTVYPTYVFGKDAYGVANWQNMETYYKPVGSAGSADPMNQIATVGAKISFATKILNNDALVRIESAATAV